MSVHSLHPVGISGQNFASLRALSDGAESKVTRLEFRSFGVVKQRQGELPLKDFLVADPPWASSHSTDFFAANAITTLTHHRLSRLQAPRTAKEARVFRDRTSPSRLGQQHTIAIRELFPKPAQKQHFSFTPSELVLPASGGLLLFSCTSGRAIESNSAWEVRR